MSNYKKDIIVIKKLPSNIVDEAIIVLKEKKTVKELENVKNDNVIIKTLNVDEINKLEKVSIISKQHIIKEAEDVVSDYIEKLVDKNCEIKRRKIEQRYNVLKYTCYILSFISLVSTLICVIK